MSDEKKTLDLDAIEGTARGHCLACDALVEIEVEAVVALKAEVRRLRAEAQRWRDRFGIIAQACGNEDPDTAHHAVRRLRAEVEAQARELERWRHGVTIEGDYVCPNALAADLARAEEREECAAICEKLATPRAGVITSTTAAELAQRIRARGGR